MPKQNLTTFYIVRHGQTDWNAKKIIQGQLDIPLNETGEKQAKEVAEKFKKLKFDLAFSSDLMRAKRTAEIIGLEHKLAIETTNSLRERAFGEMEGKPSKVFFAFRDLLIALNHEERFKKKAYENFESDEEVTTRTITFLRETAVANPGKNVLVATHGGVLRMILLHLGYFDYKTIENYLFDNLSYIKLTSDGVDFFVEETSGITKVENIEQHNF
jgi:broad specificity phosphatase PhoE